MPFIDEAIFVCPRHQAEAFEHDGKRLKVQVTPEETLLGDQLERFRTSPDHQVKNWLLRSSLPNLESLGDRFLMADDDNRPLVEIPVEMFEDKGRYHAYTTYDLTQWAAQGTDYDRGQHQTRRLLVNRGFPTRSYSAHMPQIIDKLLLAEVAAELAEESAAGCAIDEWSAYFNIAQTLYPDRFHPPTTYQTLCWPALPTDWDVGVRPRQFCFENTYPPLYGQGALFEGLPLAFDTQFQAKHTAEKIRRRKAVQSVYDSLVARMLRSAAWALHRGVSAGTRQLAAAPSWIRSLQRLIPAPVQRFLRQAARHGDDPAWSFPHFMTRVSCRRAND